MPKGATGRASGAASGTTGEPDVDPGLFDFGPETELPADAPVAALPPWMRQSAAPALEALPPLAVPAVQDDLPPPILPRARRHARAGEQADQSLAAMLSEAEQLAGSLAERPPFDRPADAERRQAAEPATDSQFDRPADAERRQAAGAAADSAQFDRPADAERRQAAEPATDSQFDRPADVERRQVAEPPSHAPDSGRPTEAAPAVEASSDAPSVPVRARPATEKAAPPVPRPRTKHPRARRVNRKPVPKQQPRADLQPVARRMRPSRTAVSRAGILAMVVGAVGAGVIGLGAVHGAPSAAPLPTADNDAINWITANLGPKASLLAPGAVAQGLGRAHFDTSRVIAYSGGSATVPDWHCCNVLLASAADGQDIQDALPPQLQAAYDSSRPIATFDESGTKVELRQVLDGTPSAVATGIETEHTELLAAGKDLIASKRIELSAAAKAKLLAGDVDSRVILALAGLAQRHLVSVADFTTDSAGTAAGATARSVVIDALDGKPLTQGNAAVTDTTSFFDAAVAPYRPMSLVLIDPQPGAAAPDLVMHFDAPGPLGLIATKVVTG